jgi:monothiol glutaredoxin
MDVRQYIESEIKNNDVVVFMKGMADLPMCGFSAKVVNILKSLGVKFKDIDVLKSEEIRQGIKDYTDWPTIPQLYVKGEFIGGCDIVSEMFASKELVKLLEEKDIIAKSM